MEGNNKYKDFTELDAWKLAHGLRTKVNILCKFLPDYKKYNVILRRIKI